MKRRVRLGITGVRYIKALVGFLLLAVALLLTVYTTVNLARNFLEDPVHSTLVLLSDILLVLVILELSKTVFSFLENDEAYLHSILEAAFIAVLREVILLEVHGVTLERGIVLALLIGVLGYVYYTMYNKGGRSSE